MTKLEKSHSKLESRNLGSSNEGCHKQKRLLAEAKSSNKDLSIPYREEKGRPKLYLRPPFFYIRGDDSLINQKDLESV